MKNGKKCHYPDKGQTGDLQQKYAKQWRITLKNQEQIEGIRRSGKLAAQILEETCRMAKAGVTTLELKISRKNCTMKPAPLPPLLGYGSPPFPKSICTSPNEVICHGIPDHRKLEEGDILNIDVTCILNGYFGDCSKMVMIGKVSEEKANVVEALISA